MTFAELRAALTSRGFSFLDAPAAGQLVNWARAELDDHAQWPYRLATLTGAAGAGTVTVPDMGSILEVQDIAGGFLDLPLTSLDHITRIYGDPSQAGTPQWAYWDPTSPAVESFPVGGTIRVRYWKVTPDLSADGDIPQSPARFHRVIVEMAVERAYRDSDNFQAAEATRVAIERDLALMRQALLLDGDVKRIETGHGHW